MRVSDFDYQLPQELIAQHPLPDRDQSRLLVLDRQQQGLTHTNFLQLPRFLSAGDLLVINDTRVLPARLLGRKATGGQVEILLLTPEGNGRWSCLAKPARRLKPGAELFFGRELTAAVLSVGNQGLCRLVFSRQGKEFLETIEQLGEMPLPPYIRASLEDAERYQTVYSSCPGAVAAPTAGLHFTPSLLEEIKSQGVNVAQLTLHIGLDTFRPVAVENVQEHKMHSEFYQLSEQTAREINATKKRGGRVVAVGTTVVRVLETMTVENGVISAGNGWTDIFIYPGYRFKCVDGLVTNFHLPRSTLLMLVSAFAGREKILNAYQEAADLKYRFYSFGDAMLIV